MICILVLYSCSWQELADIVLPNVKAYAEKQEYTPLFKSYPDVFSGYEKIRHIKAIFENIVADAVWSLDLDTLITNHTKKIEDFIDDEHDAYFTRDYNGLNCGSFIIKNSEFSLTLLDTVLTLEGLPKMYCEQDAFNEIFKLAVLLPDMFSKIKLLPHPSINSYLYENYPDIPKQTHEQGQWQQGDFVLHLPGMGLEKRIEILSKMKEQIIL